MQRLRTMQEIAWFPAAMGKTEQPRMDANKRKWMKMFTENSAFASLRVHSRLKNPPSLPRPAIQQDRDWAVVHQRHFHVRAENSAAYRLAELPLQRGAESLV